MRRSCFFVLIFFFSIILFAQQTCYDKANAYRYASDDSIFDRIRRAQQMIVNCKMPEDSFVNIKGVSKKTSSYKGKSTVINFWYLHCPPCLNEIPSFNELLKKYSDKINVVAISRDEKKDVLDFLSKHTFNAEIASNAETFIEKYNLGSGYPFTLLLDKHGQVIHIKSGGGETPETQLDLYKELYPLIDKELTK